MIRTDSKVRHAVIAIALYRWKLKKTDDFQHAAQTGKQKKPQHSLTDMMLAPGEVQTH